MSAVDKCSLPNTDSLKEDHKEIIKNNKLILKTEKRFKSEKHNIFIESINKTAFRSNDDKKNKINLYDRNRCIRKEETSSM